MTASEVVTSSGLRSLSIAVIEEEDQAGAEDDMYFDPGAMTIRQDMIPSPVVFSPPSPGFVFSGDEYAEDDELYIDSSFSLPAPPTPTARPPLHSAPPPLPGRHGSTGFRAPPTRLASLPPPAILSRPPPVLPPAPPPKPRTLSAPSAMEDEGEMEDIYADEEWLDTAPRT
eukprot:sb/3472199/